MWREALVVLVCLVESFEGKTFRFAALGDWGTGGAAAAQFFEVASAVGYKDMCQEHDVQFTISVGDNLYCDVNTGFAKSFEELWVAPGSHGGGMWLATRGNHDNAGGQFQYSSKNPKKYYFPSTYFSRILNTGLNFTVQVWSVDTHAFDGNQLKWLEASLKASTARWKFINTHYPFLSSGRHKRVPPPVTVAALAKKYGVQAVFSGHDHIVQSCISQGVAFIGTGATARGAMMDRHIDEKATDFVFTYGTKSSIGFHGMFQMTLTKNVMWGTLYSRLNVVHEFATVWDWPFKYASLGEGKMENKFPTPKMIVRYLNEEADNAPKEKGEAAAPPAAPTPSPTNKVNVSKVAAAAANNTEKIEDKIALPAKEIARAAPVEKLAVYVATTACSNCMGPSLNRAFSIWVQGVALFTKDHLLFIAYASDDCSEAGQARAAPGGAPVRPTGEITTFTLRGKMDSQLPMYVCLSGDGGHTYYTLMQADGSGLAGFTVYPEPPQDDKVTPPLSTGQEPTTASALQHANMRIQNLISSIKSNAPANTGSASGVSPLLFWALLAVGLVCVPVAWMKGRASAGRRPSNSNH